MKILIYYDYSAGESKINILGLTRQQLVKILNALDDKEDNLSTKIREELKKEVEKGEN